MHGIKRTRLSAQAEAAKTQKEQEKIAKYVAIEADVMSRRKVKDYSPGALTVTGDLLDLNPEFYTIWNYRRHILLNGIFPQCSDEEKVKYLSRDIRMTTAYLQVNPKVYWIWNHRKWCLEMVPLGPGISEEWRNNFWKIELGLIEKLLDMDARNFHAWGYRRYVLASLPSSFSGKKSPVDELRFTKKKIEANFSNFSAWHYRTKLLSQLWEGMSQNELQKEQDEEFEFVRQALWTDPGDQSAWLYHRWLLSIRPTLDTVERELVSIRELYDMEPDSKWCIVALIQCLSLRAESPRPGESGRTGELPKLISRLKEVDPYREARYKDLLDAVSREK